ncbi:MAG: hypothetical protein ACPG2Y_01615 [Acholeplasmataceae bacterium]
MRLHPAKMPAIPRSNPTPSGTSAANNTNDDVTAEELELIAQMEKKTDGEPSGHKRSGDNDNGIPQIRLHNLELCYIYVMLNTYNIIGSIGFVCVYL